MKRISWARSKKGRDANEFLVMSLIQRNLFILPNPCKVISALEFRLVTSQKRWVQFLLRNTVLNRSHEEIARSGKWCAGTFNWSYLWFHVFLDLRSGVAVVCCSCCVLQLLRRCHLSTKGLLQHASVSKLYHWFPIFAFQQTWLSLVRFFWQLSLSN